MGYRWKPSSSQRREFTERMKDPVEEAAYKQRKADKAEKRRAGSRYDYNSAGGNYIPTQFQYEKAVEFLSTKLLTSEQENACNQVMYGYSCQENIHHDYIHIVNELTRNH